VFSLAALALCGVLAWQLQREQSLTAEVLSENVGSRRAAAGFEDTLSDLLALHRRGEAGVETLQGVAAGHLAEVVALADKPAERDLAALADTSFEEYRRAWAADHSHADAAIRLNDEILPTAVRLREFNAEQIDHSERAHRTSLRRMSWGLAVVGVVGPSVSLALGYGLARGLRRSIGHLLVRVQLASDRLGEGLAVEWGGRPRPGAADDLLRRVEQAVAALQQREREVRRAERLAALGRLAAGMAHEIRNPLASAVLLVETARKDPAAPLTDEDLALIESELLRIERSLQAFLDYARPPRLERGPCDLGAVVRDALALARGRVERQGVEVRIEGKAGPWPLDADAAQLRQVVVNLVLNALDVMPAGGTLELAFRPGPRPGTIEFSVTDTGPGIAPEMLPRLFEPFASGKEAGLGLGLSVSRRIVEDHGGTVVGSNSPAGGACFVVTLPAKPPNHGRVQNDG
jgi:two-component system sensor histidine kinase HydH